MKKHTATFVACCILALTIPGLVQAADADVVVDLHAHRAEIRAALLVQTPIGSSAHDVIEFITKRFRSKQETPITLISEPATGPSAEKSRHRGVKSIRIYLGQYYDHPEVVFLSAPILMQKEVSAQWAFDEHERLVDVFIDKKNGIY